MKNTQTFAQKFLVGALALAITGLAATVAMADDVPQVITVFKVEGAVRYSADNKTWQPLRKGDVLKAGSVIQTGEKASADLLLGDPIAIHGPGQTFAATPNAAANGLGTGAGVAALADKGVKDSILHVYASSVLSVDKLTSQRTGVDDVSETQLDLRSGRILGDVKKLSAASRYEIKLPIGVAGIRGTQYTVSANGTVYVLSGSVTISYIDGNGNPEVVNVPSGSSFNPYQTSTGGSSPVATPTGYTATIPAPVLAALIAQANASGNVASPAANYTKNGTTVYISPH